MNVRHLVPFVSRRLLAMGTLMLAAGLQQPVHASGVDFSKFRRIEPQDIAALGDPGATSGSGAQSWGLWSQDPGPRGGKLDLGLRSIEGGRRRGAGTVSIDAAWTGGRGRNTGRIMEKPTFPLPPGKDLVTGDRTVTTVLTIQPKDKDGNERWNSPTARPSTMSPISDADSARYDAGGGGQLCSSPRTRRPRVIRFVQGWPCRS